MENIDQPKREAYVTNQRVRCPTKQQELVTTAPNNNASDVPNNGNDNNNNMIINRSLNYLDSFPPGYKFCPLDHELIVHYLKKKVRNEPLPPNKIIEINLYKYNPEQLAEKYKYSGENEWYFFTPRDRKYRNGSRPNRAAGDGYWKATGADKSLSFKGVLVGYRKALVFYIGKPPNGDKTNWIMHEYRVNDPPRSKRSANDMRLDDWVLCRIYKKADKSIKTEHEDEECMPVDHQSIIMFDEYENELMGMNFNDNDHIDSMGFINKDDGMQEVLQNGLPEIPQISYVSFDNFSKLDNHLRATSFNYGIFAKTRESVCDMPPPPLHSTEDDYYSTNPYHCDLAPESDKNNSQHK